MSARFYWTRTCLELQGCTLLDVYFNCLETFGVSIQRWKKRVRKKRVKIAQTLGTTCRISSNNQQLVFFFFSWSDFNRAVLFMPLKVEPVSAVSTSACDLIIWRIKADWFDKPSLTSNSFQCWRTRRGCCFFFFPSHLSIVLITTNWIEEMVQTSSPPPPPLPQISERPSRPGLSLKWVKSSVQCNQRTWKSKEPTPFLAIVAKGHYQLPVWRDPPADGHKDMEERPHVAKGM